jgi:superfamily I DNA and/or RNA helicase
MKVRCVLDISDQQSLAPKVLVIEEAGQVMEAHVLAVLFPSVEHIIAIGDPLQLRPSVNIYGPLRPCLAR